MMFSLMFLKLLIYGALFFCTISIICLLLSFILDSQKGKLW